MADNTKIEWADATVNYVNGCSVISAGCTNCYAMRLAGTRLKHHPSREGLTRDTKAGPVWTGEVRANETMLLQPLAWKRPRRIFWNAHGDLFHEAVPDAWIDRQFAVMALTPQHTHMVLTKRPERMRTYLTAADVAFRVAKAMDALNSHPAGTAAEEFVPIQGYPGYWASTAGVIYSDVKGPRRALRPDKNQTGHCRVQLARAGVKTRYLLHRLLLEAFVGPAPSATAEGRHLDGNPSNNAISNLAWGEPGENWADSKRHGSFRRYSKLTPDQATQIKLRHAAGETGEALAREFQVSATQIRNIARGDQWAIPAPIAWPLPSVWLGTSVEDQRAADERIPHLLATPAAVRFLSCEPLLGPVDLTRVKRRHDDGEVETWNALTGGWQVIDGDHFRTGLTAKIDWIIAGGESGPGARPMHPDWARSLRDQCAAAGVAFLHKQNGEFAPGEIAGEFLNPNRAAKGLSLFDGKWSECWSEVEGHCDDEPDVYRIGKARAGRLLDGRTHDDFPGSQAND